MTDTQTDTKSWKKTTSIICVGLGGILLAAGNYFGGDLDLSNALMNVVNAVSGILAGFGVGSALQK